MGSVGPGDTNVVIDQLGISVGQPDAWITTNTTLDQDRKVVDRFPAWVTNCAPPPGLIRICEPASRGDHA